MQAFHKSIDIKRRYLNRVRAHEKIIKATNAVGFAKDWFEAHGFDVSAPKHPQANGPDLTVLKNGEAYRVEVKSASKTTRSWRVGKVVNKNRDDLIAIVFSSGGVYVEPMGDHLVKCSKDGSRRITKLVQIYGY